MYKITRRGMLPGSAALVLLLSLSGAQVSSAAEAETGDSFEGPGEVRIGATWETATIVSDPSGDSNRNIPFTPLDSLHCDLQNEAGWEIATHETYPYSGLWNGGTVRLLCGTDDTSGFKHIRAGHQWGSADFSVGWEHFRDLSIDAGASSTRTWDDFMWAATREALDTSETPPQIHQPSKVCFSSPAVIWEDTEPVKKFYVNVLVSQDNAIVITSYLSNDNLSDCTRKS